MTNDKFTKLFGGPPRKIWEWDNWKGSNLASSIQAVTEEIVTNGSICKGHFSKENLCLSGGVALNCVANGKLLQEKIFKEIWIQPASGDAGGALGCALFTHYQLTGNPRFHNPSDSMKGSFLDLSSETMRFDLLDKKNIPNNFYASKKICSKKYVNTLPTEK